MHRDPKSEDWAGRAAHAFWSACDVMAFPLFGLLFLYEVYIGLATGVFLSIILSIVVFLYYLISSIISLFVWRVRRAFSIVTGLGLGVLVIWSAPTLMGWADGVQFSHQRPQFDEMVRRERVRNSGSEPIRMVVSIEDKTLLAINNSFFYIVYDETDKIANSSNAAGNWRYPEYEAGTVSVGHTSAVKHMAGHYYSFWTSD